MRVQKKKSLDSPHENDTEHNYISNFWHCTIESPQHKPSRWFYGYNICTSHVTMVSKIRWPYKLSMRSVSNEWSPARVNHNEHLFIPPASEREHWKKRHTEQHYCGCLIPEAIDPISPLSVLIISAFFTLEIQLFVCLLKAYGLTGSPRGFSQISNLTHVT